MTRVLFDELVKKWESKGILFEEHSNVSMAVFPGKPETMGLHGVLKSEKGFWPVAENFGEALCIAHQMGFHLMGNVNVDATKRLWGNECKPVRVSPKEAVIGIIPETVFQELVSKSAELKEVVQKSFPYSQEDAGALGVEDNLSQLETECDAFVYWSYQPVPAMVSSEMLYQVSNEIASDATFEGNLRGLLSKSGQQEAATMICEGVSFLSKFSLA